MFRHTEGRKKSSFLPFVLLRLCLSFVMFLILGLVAYQAFLYFSGVSNNNDPIRILMEIKNNPRGTFVALTNFNQSLRLISQVIPSMDKKSENGVEQAKPIENKDIRPLGSVVLKFALVADSHNDNTGLGGALDQAKNMGAKFVIGLGDYTDTGTTKELDGVKAVFGQSGLPYYLTAGDHDLWEARDKSLDPIINFNQLFGSPYQSFLDSGIRFVIVYNADNYEGVDSLQRTWLKGVLSDVKSGGQKLSFIFLHEPLFHPTSDKIMGQLEKKLVGQAQDLAEMFKEAGVAEIFSGNTHAYSRYTDPAGLKMTTVGAVTAERNIELPRFVLVDVYENGGYNVSDIEIRTF